MKTKKLVTKPKLRQQLMWFAGIYLVSVLAIGIFHEISKAFINLIK